MNPRLLLVSILSVLLLVFYLVSLGIIIDKARGCFNQEQMNKSNAAVAVCEEDDKNLRNVFIGQIFNAIGGLVSAFAVGFLAVTNTNVPNQGLETFFQPQPNSIDEKVAKAIPLLFVGVWLLAGVLAVIFGLFLYPETTAPLTEMGKIWLGTAVAGVAAFFGISPK